nr:MAG: hypothetical protein [Sanya fiers-like virus 52]
MPAVPTLFDNGTFQVEADFNPSDEEGNQVGYGWEYAFSLSDLKELVLFLRTVGVEI